MAPAITTGALDDLHEYGKVPIAFMVREKFELDRRTAGSLALQPSVTEVSAPYIKDYDARPGNRPEDWARRFDVRNWGMLIARTGGTRCGGAVIAWDTPDVEMLRRRKDIAVLWDIRVAPAHRGQGVGTALFTAAEEWSAARGVGLLLIETQNINVPACRFYQSMGCLVRGLHEFAYPELPDEVQIIWGKELPRRSVRTAQSHVTERGYHGRL